MGHVDHGGIQLLVSLLISARICTRSLASRLESGHPLKTRPLRVQSPARAPHAALPAGKRARLAFQVLTQAENCAAQLTRSSITSLAIFCIFSQTPCCRRPSYADTAHSSGTHRDIALFSRNVIHSFAVDQQSPPLISSSPAIMRSVVDLPHLTDRQIR